MTKIIESAFAHDADMVPTGGIRVTGNATPSGDGYMIPVETDDAEGELWAAEEHYNALELDENNVLINASLSRRKQGLLAIGVDTSGSQAGLRPKKK